jgi:hypothetical protein
MVGQLNAPVRPNMVSGATGTRAGGSEVGIAVKGELTVAVSRCAG